MAKSRVGMLVLASLTLLCAPTARAEKGVAHVGQDIVVAEGTTASHVACAFCSVHVHGDVEGNVAVAFGDLDVDAGHEVSGNVAVLGGRVGLRENSRIGGNLALIGTLDEGADASVGGSRAVLPCAVLLVPFVVLAGVIWLIVALVRRNRYRPMYPPGYPGQPI
jgi:predicted acyltransferase (DUF342 family)